MNNKTTFMLTTSNLNIRLHKLLIGAACLSAAMLFFISNAAAQSPLKIVLQNTVNYQCADNTKVNVKYYVLSDKSLYFIKIKVGKNAVLTLPAVVSASGAKYSDDMVLTWWTKGNTGTIYEQNDGPEENWPATHQDCIEVKTKK